MTLSRIFTLTLAVTMVFVAGIPMGLEAGAAEPAKPARGDFQRIEERWVRPDGGYVLDLKDIRKDGSLTAEYFNPRPIRVLRANASRKDGAIALFVELRDKNYPGSLYRLHYDSATDRLKGTYYQAVERRTFNIEFVRVR